MNHGKLIKMFLPIVCSIVVTLAKMLYLEEVGLQDHSGVSVLDVGAWLGAVKIVFLALAGVAWWIECQPANQCFWEPRNLGSKTA